MDEKPRKYDVRVVAHPPEPNVPLGSLQRTGPYYIVEQWRSCDCPDCEKDGHWMSFMGTSNKADAEAAMERRR